MPKKIVFFSLIPLLSLSTIFLVSCFDLPEKKVFVDPYSGVDKKYLKSSAQLKYISERSFSLEFNLISTDDNVEYKVNGTGWIIAREQNTNNYFLATNLHVASTIQNQLKTWEYVDNDQIYSKTGYVITKSKLGFIDPTTNNFEVDRNGDIAPISDYFSVSTPKIVYDGTEAWKNVSYKTTTKDFEIGNATSDFAILEYDLTNVEKPLKDFLKNFNNNPTKFANSYDISYSDKDTNKYYMGGYPVKEMNDGTNKAFWIGLSDLYTSSYFYNSDFISIDSQDYSSPAPKNSLQYYKSDTEKWFWNVSKDLMFSFASMGGGSSGSMVVNQNNEVVGIYWGEINFSNYSKFAPVDLLRTEAFNFENFDKINQSFPAVDLIDGFVKKMHSNNIVLNSEIENI